MVAKKVASLLQRQVNREFYSSYLYLEFANFYADRGLKGFESWYRVQAKEELDHAMMFVDYMHNNGISVELETIEKPDADLAENIDGVRMALEHERFVTESINEIYVAAKEENDFRTCQFLDWFIAEQGEEEDNAMELLTQIEMFGKDPKSLYLLDKDTGNRKYVAPSQE